MPMKLGEKLRSCRLKSGLSLHAVAAAAGMSHSYLCELENHRFDKPSADKLHALARVLGVDMNFFVDDAATSPRPSDFDRAYVRDYLSLPPNKRRYLRGVLDLLRREGI